MISQNATQYKYSINILLKTQRIVKNIKKMEEEFCVKKPLKDINFAHLTIGKR
jgi:hypothetical protein